MKRSIIAELISFLFIILFLYTGISKLMEYDDAVEQIALTPILAPFANAIVILFPIIEITAAILLFFPRTRHTGSWLSLVLMTTFTGYVIYIISFNAELPCTCGGVLEALSWPQHLILNASLIIAAIFAIRFSSSTKINEHSHPISSLQNS